MMKQPSRNSFNFNDETRPERGVINSHVLRFQKIKLC